VTGVAVDLCLGLAVLAAWLGALGFLRLRSALDRLHCASFVTTVSGPLLALAALLDEGVTTRSVKLLVLAVAMLLINAVTGHAVGRALLLRDGPQA
jgi:multicomponent Na+:H+ antiporter subunit G